MKNIIDYVKSTSQKSFSGKAFSKEDAVVLCQFSYFKFDSFLPYVESEPVDVSRIFNEGNPEELIPDPKYRKDGTDLLKAMAESVRFKDVKARFYINRIDAGNDTQFSAVTFILPTEVAFVAFRGTDETILGWREDMKLAMRSPIGGQVLSASYVSDVAERIPGRFMLGGHSKGGNLAIYSALRVDAAVRQRIAHIYALDAPGFRPEFLANSCYDEIKERITAVIPKSSVVGLLLNDADRKTVIEAKMIGVKQHNMYNWVIKRGKLEETKLSESHIKSLNTLNTWILAMDDEKLESFVELINKAFDCAGVETTVDFKKNLAKNLANFMKAVSETDDETKEMAVSFVKSYMEFAFGNFKGELSDILQSTKFSMFLNK